MKSTTDESEDNQPNPDSDRSDTDAEEQENNADTADQGAADVPSWVVGHWYGTADSSTLIRMAPGA